MDVSSWFKIQILRSIVDCAFFRVEITLSKHHIFSKPFTRHCPSFPCSLHGNASKATCTFRQTPTEEFCRYQQLLYRVLSAGRPVGNRRPTSLLRSAEHCSINLHSLQGTSNAVWKTTAKLLLPAFNDTALTISRYSSSKHYYFLQPFPHFIWRGLFYLVFYHFSLCFASTRCFYWPFDLFRKLALALE